VRKPRESRFGPTFGTTVHQAIGLVLGEPTLRVEEAVRRAARATGLDSHFEDAVADVRRAVAALDREGLARVPGADLQLEYPIAGAWDGGRLLSGYIDLVAVTEDRPTDPVQGVYPEYAAQVAAYCRLLDAAGVPGSRRVRGGLLFTADGEIRWL
jgi:hypothetical protein